MMSDRKALFEALISSSSFLINVRHGVEHLSRADKAQGAITNSLGIYIQSSIIMFRYDTEIPEMRPLVFAKGRLTARFVNKIH